MSHLLIEKLKLTEVEPPEPFNHETVPPILEKIFTPNPYYPSRRIGYKSLGSDPFWFVKKWAQDEVRIYQGTIPFQLPPFDKESNSKEMSESEAKWELMWEWSRARRELLPLIYWNADNWLNTYQLQLRKWNSTRTILSLVEIEPDPMAEWFEETFKNPYEYQVYRDQRIQNDWSERVWVRCGAFDVDQIYLNDSYQTLVFPFPEEDWSGESLTCYYIQFLSPEKEVEKKRQAEREQAKESARLLNELMNQNKES